MLTRRMQATAQLSGESLAVMEKNMNPVQRLLEPDEVAELAAFLASDSAKSITGQAYNISGGAIMH
jgi:NAD(P)-dependent dehydrogenase (short-subunit alcohol dehydrogenase family)